MTYIFEGMRQILRGGLLPLGSLAISFGLNIVYLTLSILFFGRMYEPQPGQGPRTAGLGASSVRRSLHEGRETELPPTDFRCRSRLRSAISA